MKTIFLLHLLPCLLSSPEPDTHLHVYVPPEGGKPDTGAAYGGGAGGAGGAYGGGAGGADYGGDAVGTGGAGGATVEPTEPTEAYGGGAYGGGADYQKTSSSAQTSSQESNETDTSPMGFKDAQPDPDYPCGTRGVKIRFNDDEDPSEIMGGRVAKPHAFPWMVRICSLNNEAQTTEAAINRRQKRQTEKDRLSCRCAGSLITKKHVLTSYHCVHNDECEPRDFSKGNEKIIVGTNHLPMDKDGDVNREPKDKQVYIIEDVAAPKYPWKCTKESRKYKRHAFAMLILKDIVSFSDHVNPICLPEPGAKHNGQEAVAAGWGMFARENQNHDWTGKQSELLRRVNLMVSNTKYKHKKMFGTEVGKENGQHQDPCKGDGGGPLMSRTKDSEGQPRWVIIGTLFGAGFDCKTGEKGGLEGTEEGIWNKVSAHTKWILEEVGGE